MLLLTISVLLFLGSSAIRETSALTCYNCTYVEGLDADDACLYRPEETGITELFDPPPEGFQYVCILELKTKLGLKYVTREIRELAEELDANWSIDEPIEFAFDPESNYIQFRSCNESLCNALKYTAPPTLEPADILCYVCDDCEIPNYLTTIPLIPWWTDWGDERPSNNNYTSEPTGPFNWVNYCRTTYRLEGSAKILVGRGYWWVDEERQGNWDGDCKTDEGGLETCYCKTAQCNGLTRPGLFCYNCEYTPGNTDDSCLTTPSQLDLGAEEGTPDGMQYVCTFEVKHKQNRVSIQRDLRLVSASIDPGSCLEGPLENTANPEENYIKICACNNRGLCNGNITWEEPPKLQSPIQCYDCNIANDPGCNIPDSKYLKQISAVPPSTRSALSKTTLEEEPLKTTEPIGKFHYVPYCRTSSDSNNKAIISREPFWANETRTGDLDGKCDPGEGGIEFCYCKKNGCNNTSGGSWIAPGAWIFLFTIILNFIKV